MSFRYCCKALKIVGTNKVRKSLSHLINVFLFLSTILNVMAFNAFSCLGHALFCFSCLLRQQKTKSLKTEAASKPVTSYQPVLSLSISTELILSLQFSLFGHILLSLFNRSHQIYKKVYRLIHLNLNRS